MKVADISRDEKVAGSRNRFNVPLWRPLGWVGNADVVLSESGNGPHLFISQREFEHVDIFRDVPFLKCTRDGWDHRLLDKPAQADLRVRSSVRVGDHADDSVVEKLSACDRTVCGQDHAMAL